MLHSAYRQLSAEPIIGMYKIRTVVRRSVHFRYKIARYITQLSARMLALKLYYKSA